MIQRVSQKDNLPNFVLNVFKPGISFVYIIAMPMQSFILKCLFYSLRKYSKQIQEVIFLIHPLEKVCYQCNRKQLDCAIKLMELTTRTRDNTDNQSQQSSFVHSFVYQLTNIYIYPLINYHESQQRSKGGTWVHVPPPQLEFFSKYNRTLEQYAICDDLWYCSVEHSACVSGFWGPQTPGALPPGPHWGLPSPRPSLLSPPLLANSWLRS